MDDMVNKIAAEKQIDREELDEIRKNIPPRFKVLDKSHRDENTNNIKQVIIMPLTLYALYLL